MKNRILIGLVLSLAAWAFVTTGKAQITVALEGLDPVMLVEGKESLGKTSITVTRGSFQYFFASEDNRAKFQGEPERYEIQLGGACARMGPQVGGNPDLFSVHNGRIYIFGSSDCKQNFDAAPTKYLAPPVPAKLTASAQALLEGRSLIAKVVERSGGASRIDAIKSYRQTAKSVISTQQGEIELRSILTRTLPDNFRLERIRQFGRTIDVLTPPDSFQVFIRNEQKSVRQLSAFYQADLSAQLRQSILDVMIARNDANFSAALTGENRAGKKPLKTVEVLYLGSHFKLDIDPAEGKILTLTAAGRSESTGEVGELVRSFSDFREVEGVLLPYSIESSLDGKRQQAGSMKIESIVFNPPPDDTIFRKP